MEEAKPEVLDQIEEEPSISDESEDTVEDPAPNTCPECGSKLDSKDDIILTNIGPKLPSYGFVKNGRTVKRKVQQVVAECSHCHRHLGMVGYKRVSGEQKTVANKARDLRKFKQKRAKAARKRNRR